MVSDRYCPEDTDVMSVIQRVSIALGQGDVIPRIWTVTILVGITHARSNAFKDNKKIGIWTKDKKIQERKGIDTRSRTRRRPSVMIP